MNKTLKNILLYLGEVVLATGVWCLLDYFMGDPVNIVSNLVDVAIIVLLCNIGSYIAKKFKKNK